MISAESKTPAPGRLREKVPNGPGLMEFARDRARTA
jgi:hypothetical protein